MTKPDYAQAHEAIEASAAAPLDYAKALVADLPELADWTRAFKLLNSADWRSAARVCVLLSDAKTATATMEKLQAAVVACREEMVKVDAAMADLAKQRVELRKAEVAQAAELARIRSEFDAGLATDRANHIAKTHEQQQKMAAKLAKYKEFMANMGTAFEPQHEATG
jgi:hypothetical protein